MQRNKKKKETRQGSGDVEGSPKGVTGGTTVRHIRCEVTGLASAGRYQATDQEDLTSGSKKKKQKRDWAPHSRLVMECYYRVVLHDVDLVGECFSTGKRWVCLKQPRTV